MMLRLKIILGFAIYNPAVIFLPFMINIYARPELSPVLDWECLILKWSLYLASILNYCCLQAMHEITAPSHYNVWHTVTATYFHGTQHIVFSIESSRLYLLMLYFSSSIFLNQASYIQDFLWMSIFVHQLCPKCMETHSISVLIR